MITHEGKREKIYLQPGEMLLYESAKMPHGRQFPFKGEYYDNLFVHFMLKNFKFYHTGGPIPKEEVVWRQSNNSNVKQKSINQVGIKQKDS